MVPEISTATVTFFVILGHFLPFYARNSQKNENFIKMKKVPTDTIILKKCTKNNDNRLHCSGDMAHDRCNYFSFWAIFCPFTPLTAGKMKISKKMKKKPWRYHHFTHVYQKL